METLPQELFDTIVSLVCELEESQRLPSLATVSRRWQHFIESRTFRALQLDSSQLPELGSRFSGLLGHRAAVVTEITCDMVLPSCGDDEVHERETEQDVWNYSRAISRQLHDIFGFLLILEKARSHRKGPPVELCLWTVKAPTDMDLQKQDPDRFHDEEHTDGWQQRGCADWYWSRRWRYSVHELLAKEAEALPTISCITRFAVYNGSKQRQLRCGDWVRIAMKFLHLEHLRLEFREYRANGKSLRRCVRKDFADSLLDLANRYPSTLDKVSITRNFSDTRDEAMPQIDYGHDDNGNDTLSKALCRLGEKCPRLELEGLNIAPELLWPSAWSNIKTVDIEFDPIAPNGEWYFTTADGSDIPPPEPEAEEPEFSDDEERALYEEFNRSSPTPYELGPARPPSEAESWCTDEEDPNFCERRYRVRPYNRTINPLLIAAAKAVRCMPLLDWFSMHTRKQLKPIPSDDRNKLGDERKFAVTFVPKGSGLPGLRYSWEDKAELAWDALPEGVWRPDKEVREEWAKTVGEEGLVCYIYGDKWGRGGSLRWDTLSCEEFLQKD
ncbi:uncharacterized protein K452DRAFT_362633 [Aplosporella prunicola CBS 121167]|uniref:F-box domain-containing protein n=1 Tax=Aplosporella prunicola CBS 121167 TaxID=1176127 RepID=A0A6A6AXD6_9PEZI|nr:uncharacterized protein K452DRAFT_362633 [Aplosporella prunicola CBS 121167]KAF2136276.1 hypothetical protein K452DRAFT_362633 [Aplosporella prunicola CBS 121167]